MRSYGSTPTCDTPRRSAPLPSRTHAFVFSSLIVALSCPAFAATFSLVVSGVEKKTESGTKEIKVDRELTLGPYDRIIISLWTVNGGHQHDYRLADDLDLRLAADAANGYAANFTWRRRDDWNTDGKNPDVDGRGTPAWSYHYVPFGRGGIGSESPWYAGELKPLSIFRDMSWREVQGSKVFKEYLHHSSWPRDYNKGYPVVVWRNPTGVTAKVRLTGKLLISWHGRGAADIHYAIVHSKVSGEELSVAFSVDARVSRVDAVHTHPVASGFALCVTHRGILATQDEGGSWKLLPGTGDDDLGEVTGVAFIPSSTGAFYISSADEGVWACSLSSKPRRIGSEHNGLPSEYVEGVYVYPWDARFQTLMAIHGEEAAGISLSEDGGDTWKSAATHFHAYALAFSRSGHGTTVFMTGSHVRRPFIRSVWTNAGIGEHWLEIMSDVIPTGCAISLRHRSTSFWATEDAGLFRFEAKWAGVLSYEAGPRDILEWASIGATRGARPRSEIVYAYEPRKLGLVTTEDGFRTYTSHRRGLFVGPYVRDGSHIRANASGTTFFGAINGKLYVGRHHAPGSKLEDVRISPSVMEYRRGTYLGSRGRLYEAMKAMRSEADASKTALQMLPLIESLRTSVPETPLTLSARVSGRPGRTLRVSADLSRFGWGTAVSLLDDGEHGDGAAADGVYAAQKVMSVRNVMPDMRDRGKDVRGPVAFWVTVDDGESPVSAPALFAAFGLPEGIHFYGDGNPGAFEPRGTVSMTRVEESPRDGRYCVRVEAGPGEWRVGLGEWYRRHDITGYDALGFWVKAEKAHVDTLCVHLSDYPENTIQVVTPPVLLSERDYVKYEGGGYRFYVIPLERLRKDATGFQAGLTTFVMLSGEPETSVLFHLDEFRFFVNQRDVETYIREWRRRDAQ